MFTPPPSPHSWALNVDSRSGSGGEMAYSQSISSLPSSEEKRLKFRRRARWTVILVPLVVVLITASTRYLVHPIAFDVFSDVPTWDTLVSKGTDWKPHKRHPSPEPWPPEDSSSGSGAGTSTPPSGSSVQSISMPPTPTTSAPTSSPSATSSPTGSSNQPVPTIPSSPPALPTPFPQPFDSDISQNFSSVSCANFFANMTNTPAFRSCRPFSLLLQSSASFIDAQRNLTLLNSMLWGICNTATQKDQCQSNMGWFASTLPTACADELSKNNAMASATLISLHAFGLMRDTGCLSDPTTNTFCYLNAVRNPNPSDLYYYQLPLGIGVPKAATPSCSACTRSLMDFYAHALTDPEQRKLLPQLAETYPPAASRAIQQCGGGYAKSVSSGVVVLPQKYSLLVLGLVVLVGWLYSP